MNVERACGTFAVATLCILLLYYYKRKIFFSFFDAHFWRQFLLLFCFFVYQKVRSSALFYG